MWKKAKKIHLVCEKLEKFNNKKRRGDSPENQFGGRNEISIIMEIEGWKRGRLAGPQIHHTGCLALLISPLGDSSTFATNPNSGNHSPNSPASVWDQTTQLGRHTVLTSAKAVCMASSSWICPRRSWMQLARGSLKMRTVEGGEYLDRDKPAPLIDRPHPMNPPDW